MYSHYNFEEGKEGARFALSACNPSSTSACWKSNISKAHDASNAGMPFCLNQMFRARFECLMACCGPRATPSATRIASRKTFLMMHQPLHYPSFVGVPIVLDPSCVRVHHPVPTRAVTVIYRAIEKEVAIAQA